MAYYFCITDAEVNLSCSHDSIIDGYCPGDKATFMCNTTHKLLEWTVKDQEVDFSIFDKAGTVECGLHCNISGVLVQHDPFFSSVLTLIVSEKLNNTPVQCLDIVGEASGQCLLKVKGIILFFFYPQFTFQYYTCIHGYVILAPPSKPVNMEVLILNSTSVLVTWMEVTKQAPLAINNSKQNIILYEVTASPVMGSLCETCKAVKRLTRNTSIMLFDLELLAEYEFSVQALSCLGQLESELQTKSGTTNHTYL